MSFPNLRCLVSAGLLGLPVWAAHSASNNLPEIRILPADVALEMAKDALQACAAQGFRVAVAVVDRSGIPLAQLRDEAAGPHTVESALRKAYTSASFRISSAQFMTNVNTNPAANGLRDLSGVISLAGGLPIQAGNEVVGAIGVGGAPGGDRDQACAQTALDKVRPRLD